MATAAEDQEYQQFLAFKKSQAANAAATPVDETPPVTLSDVLKTLILSARLPSETVVRRYIDAVDEHFKAADTAPTGSATDGTNG